MTSRTRGRPAWRIFRCSSRRPTSSTPTTTPTRCCSFRTRRTGTGRGSARCRRSRGAIDRRMRLRRRRPQRHLPRFLNINTTQDVSISLTKVVGRHTFKAGYYNNHSLKRENTSSAAPTSGRSTSRTTPRRNPFDTSFGFANAAIGSFSSFVQASEVHRGDVQLRQPRSLRAGQLEGEDQLTLDYGVRFVHATPQHDTLLQSGNFLPDSGCVGRARRSTCRAAPTALPVHGLEPPGDEPADRPVPRARTPRWPSARSCRTPAASATACSSPGKGIATTTYNFPKLNVGPRFGMAYDVSRHADVRRPRGARHLLRPAARRQRAGAGRQHLRVHACRRCATRSCRAWAGSRTQSPAQLTAYQYDSKLPTSTEWSIGMQMMLPWSTSVDVAYTGHHNYNAELTGQINTVDIGTAFDPNKQDPTSAPSATPGASSLAALYPDLVRGYGATPIALRNYDGWRTYHAHPVLDQPPLPERPRVRLQRRDHAPGRRQGRAALRPRRRRPAGAARGSGAGAGAPRGSARSRGTS